MSATAGPLLDEVFGIHSKPVKSYFMRAQVDGVFSDAMRSDNHIVVYGSSKQGKTALLQAHVPESDRVTVRCNPRHSVLEIYSSILRQANVAIEAFETTMKGHQGTARVKLGFKARLPWIGGAEAGAETEGQVSRQTVLQTDFVAYDFNDAQAISELLVRLGFKKFVVLENFHYLPEETQRQLAFDLKTFHEIGIRFIVLGIWQETNLLMNHNGDLQDRVAEIPVEPWHPDDFAKVATNGAFHLNVSITDAIVRTFTEHAYGNVGMLQEFLRHFCLLSGVRERQDPPRLLDSTLNAEEALAQKLTSQRAQLVKSLQAIASASRIRRDESDPLLLPYYLVKVILKTPVEKLREGIDRAALLAALRDVHHRTDKDTVRGSDVTNLLTQLSHYQLNLQPPFLYYDGNARRLKIVDTRQFFVLAKVNRQELEEEIPIPAGGNPSDDEDSE